MKQYYRIMAGPKSVYAEDCKTKNYIGCNFNLVEDLKEKLTDNAREFNREFIPKWLSINHDKSKISAGLACGAIWTIAKGIKINDIILCPDGYGRYMIGEVVGDYLYQPELPLPHTRVIKWLSMNIDRSDMSEGLQNSTGSIGTVSNITKHAAEIEALLKGIFPLEATVVAHSSEDLTAFAIEKQLEDFLIHNWKSTSLGKEYDIYQEDGELIGQQYPSDTGPIDILAVSKDRLTILVVELKRGKASDVVVGQIQRYMGYVKEMLCDKGQNVKGVIIAMDDDLKIKRALSVTNNIEFFKYRVSFSLYK